MAESGLLGLKGITLGITKEAGNSLHLCIVAGSLRNPKLKLHRQLVPHTEHNKMLNKRALSTSRPVS